MGSSLDKWQTQIRKGYLELCILLLIRRHGKLYGFDLIEKLKDCNLPVKEGTLYPLLNRMTTEGLLEAVWQTENLKGHPRKFYSLSKGGKVHLGGMEDEYHRMSGIFTELRRQTNVE